MTYSFSRLHCFENCKYEFYLRYIEKRSSLDNFYGEFGTLLHDILERILTGEISIENAANEYMDTFDKRTPSAVFASTREKYYDIGFSYLTSLNFDWIRDYEILGVEKKVQFYVKGYPFVGYIDLLLRNPKTGEIYVIDHKSAEYPLTKNKTIKKKKEEDFLSYRRQLYLYCKAIYDEYGCYPSKIIWNYFREWKWLPLLFNGSEYEDALSWADALISELYKEDSFPPKVDYFYCHNLCGYRKTCEYRDGEYEK